MAVSVYEFEIQRNRYLKENCIGYYSMDFKSVRQGGELSFLHKLKNNKLNIEEDYLIEAKNEARTHIATFLMAYDKIFGNKIREQILVCRVPRSKTYFEESQLYFQQAIREAVATINSYLDINLVDGIDYIRRVEDVATTHLASSQLAQVTLPKLCSGDKPYPGITRNTCFISEKVANRTILLIDDIYTLGVGVVEDCIQALYDKGAKKVIFYAVGRTNKWGNTPEKEIGGNRIAIEFGKEIKQKKPAIYDLITNEEFEEKYVGGITPNIIEVQQDLPREYTYIPIGSFRGYPVGHLFKYFIINNISKLDESNLIHKEIIEVFNGLKKSPNILKNKKPITLNQLISFFIKEKIKCETINISIKDFIKSVLVLNIAENQLSNDSMDYIIKNGNNIIFYSVKGRINKESLLENNGDFMIDGKLFTTFFIDNIIKDYYGIRPNTATNNRTTIVQLEQEEKKISEELKAKNEELQKKN